MSQQCGLEVEKGDDECFAIAQRCPLDEAHLKAHPRFAEHPGLPLQPSDKRRQVATLERAHDLLHDKRLPRSGRRGATNVSEFSSMRYLMKARRPDAAIDVRAELGIERDGSIQQERRDGLVLEPAGAHEGVVDGRQIVRLH